MKIPKPLITLPLFVFLMVAVVLMMTTAAAATSEPASHAPSVLLQDAEGEGCLSCHEGIELIRAEDSGMMKDLRDRGECTACHGGDPGITGTPDDDEAVEAAHTGAPDTLPFTEFYPDPGSVWVAQDTCGQCHTDYAHVLERSLMNTEAGKIQGNLWTWGVLDSQKVIYGNYDVTDSETLFGSDAYKEIMQGFKAAYPDQFPDSLEMLLNPTVEEVEADPSLAGFTYQRQQCQRCHVGVTGRSRRGDWRGMGCSSCHIPYGNEGFYEGGDPTVPTDEEGHLLIHSIQGTREARNGIPSETCNSCHNRGKRIGVSFQGLMEFPYGTPIDDTGGKQPRLHTKQYLFIKADLHHEQQSRPENPEGGMLCQDCHTSIEMHGDGNIFGTTLSQVEIECADCHGTSDAYPWELPLGYGEEFSDELSGEPRGVAGLTDLQTTDGTLYDPEDGYLLSARGNPLGNVTRASDGKVIVHSATDRDFFAPLLKTIAEADEWISLDADVAMDKVGAHMEALECYACHADWAPQCYGCHVDVNYGENQDGDQLTDTDWVASGNDKNDDGTHNSVKSPGKVSESRSYLRWEQPILGINGEGRVTPLIPGCQVIFTVRGPEGDTWTHNEIARTPPGTEGSGPEGQRGLDMAPVQPHTAGREARTCESCHSNPKSLGYGTDGGRYLRGYTEDRYVDLMDADGNVIPQNVQVQMPAIPDLPMDLSQIVDPETGQQMMTVGSHWPDSRPLDENQRVRMERTGVCMGCHQNMADPAFWNDQVIASFGEVISNDEHINVMNEVINASVMQPVSAGMGDKSTTMAPPTSAAAVAAVNLAPIEDKITNVESMADEAQATAQDAQMAAGAAQSAADEAQSTAEDAMAKAQAAETTATQAEVGFTEMQAEAENAASATSKTGLWVIVALLLGLIAGGGAVYFARK
ncbi:MAG: cytochrome c3 family protein [Chloroflexota bacterium]|nr:cytochrome c3 family protein [Chloroflexota bacterium]